MDRGEISRWSNRVNQAIRSIAPAPPPSCARGIVMCGGGYKYFTNAWIAIKLLRHHGCELPIELWMTRDEYDRRFERWLRPYDTQVRIADDVRPLAGGALPREARWQWILKPYALTRCAFNEVLLLDADNFAVRDPTYLFSEPEYTLHGAMFWPDLWAAKPDCPSWEVIAVEPRREATFESGQILVNKARCWEPLQLALWMNVHAKFFYQIIWGDKDTFRLAWHKFGRNYAMPQTPIQLLAAPTSSCGYGVMCQHDIQGARILQHRNMAKWDLLGENPFIPGYFYDRECRQFLTELRASWDGRLSSSKRPNVRPPSGSRSGALALVQKRWLFEDRRPRIPCCGPPIAWSPPSVRPAWHVPFRQELLMQTEEPTPIVQHAEDAEETKPAGTGVMDAVLMQQLVLHAKEVTLHRDGTVEKGADEDMYWWEFRQTQRGKVLRIHGNTSNWIELRPDGATNWKGY